MKILNETRVVLLLSMNQFYMTLVSVGINLKLLQDLLLLLKTNNKYLTFKTRSYSTRNKSLIDIYFMGNKLKL